jgi:hypothetical protein
MVAFADLTLESASQLLPDTEARDLLREMLTRKQRVAPAQDRFRQLCDRFDNLYFTPDITTGGADLWASHPSAYTPGKSHVSVNTPHVYVDIPAALQAVEPITNMEATDTTEESRNTAQKLERVYGAWKREEQWPLKRIKACTAKGLYGKTAALIYWDAEEKHPCAEIIDQPRNLYLGWKSDTYDELSWAAYVQRMTPEGVLEEFSVEIDARDRGDGTIIPWVRTADVSGDGEPTRSWLSFGDAQIEVWNYWFLRKKKAVGELGKATKMTVWNAVFVGNELVRYAEHPEYDGELPVKVLFNSYIPGSPDGRSDLFDVEQLIREKQERITAGAQMISAAAGGTFWQLTGPETPTGKVPAGVKPKLNEVISPGAGNRIEPITPNVIQFQLESYLDRIDREMVAVTGLSDLHLGISPLTALSSSKAMNALMSTYEVRLAVRRGFLFAWEKEIWELVVKVWAAKDEKVREIVDAGGGTLDIQPPSLGFRDDMENATRISNLVNAKLFSLARGMDAVGVDDPEEEQDIIRSEQTDATLNPASVQVMAQLMAALQSLGINAPQGAQQQAQQQVARGQSDLRNALGAQTPASTTSSQLPGDQGVTPPEAMVPGATPPAGAAGQAAPFASAQAGPGLAQTMIQNGKAKSRILTSQPLGKR